MCFPIEFGAVTASKSVSVKAASQLSLRIHPLIAAICVALKPVSGVQNRGFDMEISDFRGDLGADERVEMGSACLGGG